MYTKMSRLLFVIGVLLLALWPGEGSAQGGAAPVASFIAKPQSGRIPHAVQFSNRSTGEIASVLWDFGDGSTSTDVNPRHTYQRPGLFDVSLTVRGPGGENKVAQEKLIFAADPSGVVFEDFFGSQNPASQWTFSPLPFPGLIDFRRDRISMTVGGKLYAFAVPITPTNQPPVRPLAIPQEYRVEMDARKVGAASAAYGILFSLGANDLAYVFEVDPDRGAFRLRSGGRPLDWIPAAAIRKGNEVNHLGVQIQGGAPTLFINGVAVQTATDAILEKGFVGVTILSLESTAVRVDYDDFLITQVGSK